MSPTVLGIALAMAAPVFFVGALTKNKNSMNIAAGVMFVLALLTGNISFFMFDAIAIGIVWFISVSMFDESEPTISIDPDEKMMPGEDYVDYGVWRVDDGRPSGVFVAATTSKSAPAFLLYVDDPNRPNQLVQVLIPSVKNRLAKPLWSEAEIGCQRATPDEFGEDDYELYVRTVTETDEPAKGQTLVTIWSDWRDSELNTMMESDHVYIHLDGTSYLFSMNGMAEAVSAVKG